MATRVEQVREIVQQIEEIEQRMKRDAAEKAALEARIEALFSGQPVAGEFRRGPGRPRSPVPGAVQRLVQIINTRGGTATVDEMTKALGTTEGNTRNLLAKAGKLGLIEKRPGKGVYGIVRAISVGKEATPKG